MLTVEKQVKLFMYVVYLIVLLVGCTVGLVLFFKSFAITRETRLEIYNEDISIWNTTKRTEFKDNGFWVQFVNSTGDLISATEKLNQTENESLEHQLIEDTYGELPSYEPFYYSTRENAAFFGVESTFSSFDANEKLEFKIKVDETPTAQVVSIPKLSLYSVKSMKMAGSNGCARHKGHYETSGNTCYVYSILSHVCIQLDKDEGGNWYLNTNENTDAFG
mmetsp:Transcript_23306/g.20681  ORF Transcript_23306/g.20681 Transcript_23306/m.20681 type:complete len:220 (+) Transcript_23306:1-660(+)